MTRLLKLALSFGVLAVLWGVSPTLLHAQGWVIDPALSSVALTGDALAPSPLRTTKQRSKTPRALARR